MMVESLLIRRRMSRGAFAGAGGGQRFCNAGPGTFNLRPSRI